MDVTKRQMTLRRAAAAFCCLLLLAGCFQSGNINGDDTSSMTGPDAAVDTMVDPDGDAISPDGGDACGGCADGEVCDADAEECVECTEDDHCTGDKGVCDTDTNTCVACEPGMQKDWYPDSDGDGFGDSEADPETACAKPDGKVENSGDCDDGDKAINPDAEEVCDGVDQNCNGTADQDEEEKNITPGACPSKNQGVCSEVKISACNMNGEAYRSCTASDFSDVDAYRDTDDEAWRCDGKDNDCDGDQDEACCAMGDSPTITQIGPAMADQANPVIVPAAPGAPMGAEWLVAWAEGKTVKLQHINGVGDMVGNQSISTKTVTALDIARRGNGYFLGTTHAVEVSQGSDKVFYAYAHRVGADLSKQSVEIEIEKTINGISEVGVAVAGKTGWFAHNSKESQSGSYLMKVSAMDLQDGSIKEPPFALFPKKNKLPKAAVPDIEVVMGKPIVGWWDPVAKVVRGVWIDGGTVKSDFGVGVGTMFSKPTEPVEFISLGGDVGVVFPDYPSNGNAALQYLKIGPNESGTISTAPTALTGSMKTNRQPAARAVDSDGDGTDDRLVVVWGQGSTGDPAIMIGQTDLQNPQKFQDAKQVKGAMKNNTDPSIALNGERAAVVVLETVNRMSKDVKYAPLSIDGQPICNPAP